ncbi:pentatricopeptide repeat-containing protein [Tanacetum coccineum]
MGDKNPICTLGYHSKPSHEGYRNTIELHVGNNVVPLRSDTIRLVQNRCSFHGLRSEDPNQHLKDFLKLVDSHDLDGSITTWDDLTTRFLAQFIPSGSTTKLRNDILMFQQHHGESLSEAWTRFKNLLQKVHHHGIDLWLQKQTALAISTTEAEYVSAEKACQQALWMKQALIDYDDVPIIICSILDITCEGACVFTDKWSLDELANGVPTDGPYQTNPPSPDDIISYIQIDQEGQVRRIHHEEEIDVHEHQILTREIVPTLKPLEEIIQENFNLAYYMAKQIEWVTKQARLILPYGMLLTRLFKFVMSESSELSNESYVLYDRVMNPLTAHQERKTRKDHGTRRGRHSTSSSSAFDQPSSSYLNDADDDGNGEGTSRASTPSPIRFVNSLTNDVPQVFQNPPNIDPHMEPFYTAKPKSSTVKFIFEMSIVVY